MIKRLKIVILLTLMIFMYQCEKLYIIPQNLEVHDFAWKGLNAYYLYQDEIQDLSDRRFNSDLQLENYLQNFSTPENLFASLLKSSDTASKIISDFNMINQITDRTSFTTGMEFGILEEPDTINNVIGYVSHILPNSNATSKNITRGDFFYGIDNVTDTIQLTKENYQDLLINTTDTIKLLFADFDGDSIIPNGKKANLIKRNYTHVPVFSRKTINHNSTNVGYLLYNNDFSSRYINDLNNAFFSFKNESVNELILDLRYNIGGGSFEKTVTELASMITGQFDEETLLKRQWNTKAQPWFELNQPDSLLVKFPKNIDSQTAINSLNLTKVYIILNGSNYTGSSSIELLINSLKPYIEVHVVGNQTTGNNTGAITLYNSIDYDSIGKNTNHMYALQPKVLRFLNKNDETFATGITPNFTLCTNEDILNLGVLGEVSDPILNRVLEYVTTGGINTMTCNPNNFEFLYHSIDSQRVTDTGVFITQDLPNTN
ncbi:peptidase S41-like protein [Lutibacter sp. Hel_I_33_5]|uniref:S41 family peptidase n=1 Tax=Lutibacter sp. Hel_I_33_5 TaxID=1566289 RepID=UPI0011ABE257|nr:S41 family peptidase [Lutibacter sp. Hel_I_33_5]TVZ54932.1 peptidase S41-like protein [Lutibacter sp. Hel_I_33_5]